MKVDILSMQRIYNYGSFLQAYGLMKLIEERGHDVEFIDIEAGEHEGVRVEKGTVLADHKRTFDRYALKRFIFKIRAEQRNKMFEEQRRKYLKLPDEECTSIPCDLAVIGSDEVFNCNKANPYGISLQLFGKIDCAKKVISYAASCGYTDYTDVPEEYKISIRDALNNLSLISVRDKNTFEFVEKMTGIQAEYNLDPVLIYPFKKEVEQVENKVLGLKKYMVVYAYKNRFKNVREIEIIKKFARSKGLKIIRLGDSQYWADDFMIPTPFELLAYFKNAEYVLTDTFHGTIMAAKYHKKVAVVIRPSNENKLGDLISRIGLEKRKIESFSDFQKVIESECDYENFEVILKKNRILTEKYLDKAGL